jgi:phage tail-like protein
MAPASRRDPYGAFRFLIEFDSMIVGGCSEVSGVSVETEVEEQREGGVNDRVHYVVKGSKSPRLVLKRGLTDADALWRWHHEVVAGRIRRHDGRILLLDVAGNEVWRWNIEGAYPVKWSGPDLRADSQAVAFESLELVHQGITKG